MKKLVSLLVFMAMLSGLIGSGVMAEGFGRDDCTYRVFKSENFWKGNTDGWERRNIAYGLGTQGNALYYGVRYSPSNEMYIKKQNPSSNVILSTEVYIENAGKYYIWANVNDRPNGMNRSGYMWLDSETKPSNAYNFCSAEKSKQMLTGDGWYWDRNSGTQLEKGWHTIYMSSPTDSFRVGVVVLTDDDDENLLNGQVSEDYANTLEPLIDITSPEITDFGGVSADFDSLTLNWSVSDDRGVVRYDVFEDGVLSETLDSDSGTGVLLEDMMPLCTKKIKLTAYDANGNKTESEEKSFIVTPFELQEMKLAAADGTEITSSSQLAAGMTVKLTVKFKNNAASQLPVLVGAAVYSKESGRMTASKRISSIVESESESEALEMEITLPENFVPGEDSMRIAFWDTADTMMPVLMSKVF